MPSSSDQRNARALKFHRRKAVLPGKAYNNGLYSLEQHEFRTLSRPGYKYINSYLLISANEDCYITEHVEKRFNGFKVRL